MIEIFFIFALRCFSKSIWLTYDEIEMTYDNDAYYENDDDFCLVEN